MSKQGSALSDSAIRRISDHKRVRNILVTARDIRRFSQAIGASLSRNVRDEDVVAPPLFYQTMAYEDVELESLPEDGSPIEADVPIPAKRTVGGSSQFEVVRCARAGDKVRISTAVRNVYSKQGRSGTLYFVVVETSFRDDNGDLMARETATYIKKP